MKNTTTTEPLDGQLMMPDLDEGETTAEPTAAESEATGELVQGQLAGRDIWCPPVKKWRASALYALRQGDMTTWAESTLLDDDWEIWQEVDPTIEQVNDFFGSMNLGADPGNSRASKRSSRPTRRR